MSQRPLRRVLLGVIGATLTASTAVAGERALEAHQHGHGILNIAIEGQTLWIELEAPGADIVGFEHPARSDEDKAAIDAAKSLLGEPFSLLGVPASCALDDQTVALIGDESHHDDHDEVRDDPAQHHHEADSDEHAHHDDHEEAHHDRAQDDAAHHDDHAGDESHHTAFRATYKMRCTDLSEIETLSLDYFTVFPAAQELDVSVISETRQHRQEVTRGASTVHLSGD